MRKRVGLLLVSVASLACSGEDAGPPGGTTGAQGGGRAGASGTSSVDVGGRTGRGGSAGLSGSTGASGFGLGGAAGSGGGAGASATAGAGGKAGAAGTAGMGGATGPGGGTKAPSSTIVAGDDHSCAIAADGSVFCWGARGDLPTQTEERILVAPEKLVLPPMQSLVGHRHFCALAAGTRALHCWGQDAPNADKEKDNPYPAAIDVGGTVDEVAIAFRTTCVRLGSKVSCFGLGALGGTGVSAGQQGNTQVPGITDALSLTGSGSIFCARRPAALGGVGATCWGEGLLTPTDVPGETSVASVAITAEGYVLVRRSDGTVGAHRVLSGAASGGGFGPVAAVPIPPVDVIVADNSLCAIRSSDQRVVCASLVNRSPETAAAFIEVQGLPDGDPAVEISTNASHSNYGLDTSCARTSSGKSFCWGADRWAQAGAGLVGWELQPKDVAGVSKATRLALGMEGTVALVEGGSAVGWGSLPALGQQLQDGTSQLVPMPLPGTTDTLVDLTVGGFDDLLYGVTKTGSLYVAQNGSSVMGVGLQAYPGMPTFLPGVVRLAQVDFGVAGTGSDTFLAFFVSDKDDPALGKDGILANGGGPAKSIYSSVAIPNLVGFAYGSFHGLAWDTAGALHCWGGADVPRCGQPASTTMNVVSPVVVPLPGEEIVAACGGWDHTCAITKTGGLRCWGASNFGLGGKLGNEEQPDDKGLTEPLRGVACGNYTSCVWSDTKVSCWGRNDTGLLGLGDRQDRLSPTLVPGLSGAKHVAIGSEHSCAVKMDGSVACWGSPSGGRLGNGKLGYDPVLARGVVGLP